MSANGESGTPANPTVKEVTEKDTSSFVAVAGHPMHAMSVHFPIALVIVTLGCDLMLWWSGDEFWVRAGLWAAGGAFLAGLAAGIIGTAELLFVAGIRLRVASWTHAIAAVVLIAVMGLNWGIRLGDGGILPHGLLVSVLAAILTGMAGWHGGKLVFDHGVGLIISEDQ